MRIGVSAVWAAAGPGMATPVDEPLLNDHRAGLVTRHRTGMSTYRGVPCFRTLDALTRPVRLGGGELVRSTTQKTPVNYLWNASLKR